MLFIGTIQISQYQCVLVSLQWSATDTLLKEVEWKWEWLPQNPPTLVNELSFAGKIYLFHIFQPTMAGICLLISK